MHKSSFTLGNRFGFGTDSHYNTSRLCCRVRSGFESSLRGRYGPGGCAGLWLAQPEVATRLVDWHGDVQARVVGHRHFDGGLPIRWPEARCGFEDKSGGGERPGNGDGGVAARNAELRANGD